MRTPHLRLFSALLLLALLAFMPNSRATADELTVEHVTASQFKVGDIVTVVDADGEEWPLKIVAIDHESGSAKFLDQSGKEINFPANRIRGLAGKGFRLWSWLTRTTGGNWTLGSLLTAVGGVAAKETLDVSEKDNDNRVDAATAAAQSAEAAAHASRDALTSGTPDGSGFYITGTFAGSEVPTSATARYTPTITFGRGLGSQGGAIAMVTLPPDANGAPQEQRDVGRWSAVSANEISISDLPAPYAGVFTITGIAPYGSTSASPATLNGPRGIALYGGYVISATPPQEAQP